MSCQYVENVVGEADGVAEGEKVGAYVVGRRVGLVVGAIVGAIVWFPQTQSCGTVVAKHVTLNTVTLDENVLTGP